MKKNKQLYRIREIKTPLMNGTIKVEYSLQKKISRWLIFSGWKDLPFGKIRGRGSSFDCWISSPTFRTEDKDLVEMLFLNLILYPNKLYGQEIEPIVVEDWSDWNYRQTKIKFIWREPDIEYGLRNLEFKDWGDLEETMGKLPKRGNNLKAN